MLIIFATNIHQGGGATLLGGLLEALYETGLSARAFVDERMPLPERSSEQISFSSVKPTLPGRFRAEQMLRDTVSHEDTVLCLGNLPPLFDLPARVYLYVQNRYLVERGNLSGFQLKTRLRIQLERLWLKFFAGHVNVFLVQTPTMRGLLQNNLVSNGDIRVWPFLQEVSDYQRSLASAGQRDHEKVYDFLYVASGEPHKNHRNLIEAWCLLAQEELFPGLCLTLDEDHALELWRWMQDKIAQYKLNVVTVSLKSRVDVEKILGTSRAVIYPSRFESFGLPLIEARQAGLPVLAGELDYVRDVLDPEETFNPASPLSIGRAVKRFLGVGEKPLDMMSAKDFITRITND